MIAAKPSPALVNLLEDDPEA